jgi:hypothetical protein
MQIELTPRERQAIVRLVKKACKKPKLAKLKPKEAEALRTKVSGWDKRMVIEHRPRGKLRLVGSQKSDEETSVRRLRQLERVG